MRSLREFIASERGEISPDTIALAGGLLLLALALSNFGGVRGSHPMRIADRGADPVFNVTPPIRTATTKAVADTAMAVSTRQ